MTPIAHKPAHATQSDHELLNVPEDSIALGHVARTLSRYRYPMALSLAGVLVVYGIFAILTYLSSPVQKITSLPFRLEFEGSDRGVYPNGTKFSSSEIVATPVLMKVFKANDLDRFTSFNTFSQSVFIVESNKALEQLSREYRAKLSDPKLNPVDRERLESEYGLKRESLSRSEYSINFLRREDTGNLPDNLVAKSLVDTLSTWAASAAQEKGVMRYRTPVLSRNVLSGVLLKEPNDYVIALDLLRTRVSSVIRNIDDLLKIFGAEVLRTGQEQISLHEIRLKLADTVRFKIQPMLTRIRATGPTPDPPATIRFLQSQLGYNEQQAKAAEARARALRDALALYVQKESSGTKAELGAVRSTLPAGAETIMPQISESFLDRIIGLTEAANDVQYRQDLVDRVIEASLEALPYQDEALYYRELIHEMRDLSRSPANAAQSANIERELQEIFQEVATAIDQVNGIYNKISQNLNPSTILYTMTSPPMSSSERAASPARLALYGLLLFLIAIPVVAGVSLLHNRIREEERIETELVAETRRYPEPSRAETR